MLQNDSQSISSHINYRNRMIGKGVAEGSLQHGGKDQEALLRLKIGFLKDVLDRGKNPYRCSRSIF
jgi:hypothetical protein